jgi:hypothetical protein
MSDSIESVDLKYLNNIQKNIIEVIAELRHQLAVEPKAKTHEWQIKVGNLISLICADFPKQEESKIALIEISLVSLAAQKGCKEAKKRALKPTRWISNPPPCISDVFDEIDEAKNSIRVLQKIKADWIESYICIEIGINKWPDLSAPLVDWLINASQNVESFLRALNKIYMVTEKNIDTWLTPAIENASKSILKSKLPPGVGIMAETEELATKVELNKEISPTSLNINSKQEFQTALSAFISNISREQPSILIQGAVVATIKKIFPKLAKKNNSLTQNLEIMCRRTLSLFEVVLQNADKNQLIHYRNIWSAYQHRLTIADQLLKKASESAPILNLLLSNADCEETHSDFTVTAGLENILCNLVVNWDEYYTKHLSDPAAQQLSSIIDDMISQLQISRFGHLNQNSPFDPNRHFLISTSAHIPSKVTIIKPGLLLQRSDGSYRILLKAASSPLIIS